MTAYKPTDKTHSQYGSLTASEMTRRHDAWVSEQPLKVGCAIDGCDWPGVELPTAEARAASLAHRLAVHPERADAGKLLRQRQKDVRAEKGLRPVAIPRSDVLEAMEEEAA